MAMPSRIKISDIANVKGGKRLPKGHDLLKVKTSHPYIRARDIRDGKITFDEPVYINDETYKKIKKYIVDKDDVCITIVGANVGDVGQVPTFLNKANLTENAVKIIGKSDDYVADFVKYALLTDDAQKQMKNFAAGAAQPKLGIYKINEVEIPYPQIETRKSISEILNTYDNLIENNNRRIAILEEMARSLYREWFVNFRFPGHQNTKFIDSPLGKIPKGWEVMSASEAIDINPRTKLPKEGEKPFVPMSGLSESSMLIGDIQMKSGNSGTKFINGDTLFARITPCLENGKTGFVQFLNEENPVGFGSTEFIILREKLLNSEFIYTLSRSDDFRNHAIKSMTGATGRQRVQNASFDSFMLSVPPKKLLSIFQKAINPKFQEIFILNKKNINLKNQRDLLLPKLISGNINLIN